MEDWEKDVTTFVETVSEEIEQFVQELTQTVDEVTREITTAIADEVENFLQELWDNSGIEIRMEHEIHIITELENDEDLWLNPKVNPTPEHHPACQGCANYHGRIYNGNLLVCGMHPYGWDGENCPDWEQE